MSKSTKRVPEGFHTVTPHLVIKNCAEAIEFYKRAFAAEELERHPMPQSDKIMHAKIRIGDSILMLCDEFGAEHGCEGNLSPQTAGGTTVSLHLYLEDVDSAWKTAVDAGCAVRMPLSDTFWGDRYGQVSDPYGHLWSLSSHLADMTQDEVAEAAESYMESCKESCPDGT